MSNRTIIAAWLAVALSAATSATRADEPPVKPVPARSAEPQLTAEQQERLAEAKKLSAEVMQFFKRGKYREAVPLARQALAIHIAVLGRKHLKTAASHNSLGLLLHSQGDYAGALPHYEQALAIRKEVLGDKHSDTAQSLNNVGSLLQSRGDFAAARPYFEQALAIRKEMLGDKHPITASCLSNLGVLLKDQGEYAAARSYYEQALAIRKEALGHKHLDTAISLGNLGLLFHSQGDYAAARPYTEQALAIRKEVLGSKHPDTASSLNNLGHLLHSQGDFAAARPYFEQALAIRKEVLGDKHADTASSLNNLGVLLRDQGEYAAARPYFEQALSIRKEVLRDGHPDTAASLNNLAVLLDDQGDYAAARPYFEQALAISKKVMGDKHADTARLLNNMGSLLVSQKDYAAARESYEQALAINKTALGDKHPDTAISLDKMGWLLVSQRDYTAARPYYEQALAINRAALGDKHPNTASTLNKLGHLFAALNDWDGAITSLAEAVQLQYSLRDTIFAATSEAEALNYSTAEQKTQDALISAWRHTSRPAHALYEHLWPGRAALFEIVSSRQRGLDSSGSPEAQRRYNAWIEARYEVARLTLAPANTDPARQAARRQRLLEAAQRKEEAERELARVLPDFAHDRAALRRAPTDLRQALPADAAYVDLLRYTRFEHDSNTPGKKGDSWTPSYVAFVLARDREIALIDLGPAAPIEAAAAAWRKSILDGTVGDAHSGSPPGEEGETLRRLVWQPIAEALAADVKTVYLVPSGPLASLPWSALPGRKPGTVLLEDYALAIVPNGQFLLAQLTSSPSSAIGEREKNSVLAVGGVQYDRDPISAPANSSLPNELATLRAATVDEKQPVQWSALPGTSAEVEEVQRLAHPRTVTKLTGEAASTAQVLETLPKVRWAALATHGFFADPKFRSAFQLDERDFERRQFMMRGERTTVAGRNPLVLSGLVLAGANLPRATDEWGVPKGDGGILTAEAIAGMNLSNLELAVLSACETGLGDVAGGEGVFGLQRAFHIAGCRNVIASLWTIDDHATQTLMARFYGNLWQKNMPPLEALREAQLAMYYGYEPSSGKLSRGQGEQVAFDAARARPVQPADQRRASPRYWAAFMLSGSGR